VQDARLCVRCRRPGQSRRGILKPLASPSGLAFVAMRHTSSDRQFTMDSCQSHDNSERVRWSVHEHRVT
jgi:hypothetical protein